jgi:hypothetical protein
MWQGCYRLRLSHACESCIALLLFTGLIYDAVKSPFVRYVPILVLPFLQSNLGACFVAVTQITIIAGVAGNDGKGAVFSMMFIMPLNVVSCVGYTYWRYRGQTRHQLRWFFMFSALACFLIGYLAWNLDVAGVACMPRSWLQGHAAWHGRSTACPLLFAPTATQVYHLSFHSVHMLVALRHVRLLPDGAPASHRSTPARARAAGSNRRASHRAHVPKSCDRAGRVAGRGGGCAFSRVV